MRLVDDQMCVPCKVAPHGYHASHGTERRSNSCHTHAGAVVNGGVSGFSLEQGIAQQRHEHEHAHVGIRTGVGEEGHRGAEGVHETGWARL
jgi:hypothetical protein